MSLNFCTKACIATLALIAMMPMAKANEVIVHTVAYHTGDYDYNNDTFGVGVKLPKGFTVGGYKHSYTDEGTLKGVAVYINKPVAKTKVKDTTLDLSVAMTYGYPERLKGNYKGFMAIPTMGITQKLTKDIAVNVQIVPGQLVGNDSAAMLSFVFKDKK